MGCNRRERDEQAGVFPISNDSNKYIKDDNKSDG